jgi:glycine/D-amino acid oxidase-like deaminating enzyme
VTGSDVIVIGGGMVGTAIAYQLAGRGATVELIEQQFAAAGSTGAAMGHLVVMDDSAAQLALATYSLEQWRMWFTRFPADVEFSACGTLWVAAGAAELEAAAAKVETLAQWGVRAELLDQTALREAEPALRHELAGGLRVPDDMVCYPPAVARALATLAVAHGVRQRQARVVALEPGGVRLADGSVLQATTVVVATGAASADLVPGLPLVPRRGHLVITDRTPLRVNHQLVELGYLDSAHTMGGASVAFNVQPRLTGQLLIGSSRELVGFDPSVNRDLVAQMLTRATSFLPELGSARALRTWVGYRPATPDALPLIGAWPALPGVWVATGHEGLGITMAPGTAALVAALIAGEVPPFDPAPYRPDRPLAAAA